MPIASSLGGPHVMLPTSEITRWIQLIGDYPEPHTGLYGLACSVENYCGVIEPWGIPLIVFGDDPADIYSAEKEPYTFFFRWLGADTLVQLQDFAFQAAATNQWDEVLELKISDSHMSIIDSCASPASPRIDLQLKTGEYIMSSTYAQSSDVATIVHRLEYVG